MSGAAIGFAGFCATHLRGAEWASSQERKGRIRQSISKWCYNGKLLFEDLCRRAASTGYQAVDLIGPDDWSTAQKYGLTCAITPGPGSNADGLPARPGAKPTFQSAFANAGPEA